MVKHLQSIIGNSETLREAFESIKKSTGSIDLLKMAKFHYEVIDGRKEFAVLKRDDKEYIHPYGTNWLYSVPIF